MPQSNYYRDYKIPHFNNQNQYLVSGLGMDPRKKNPNRKNEEHLPSLPPLIPMSRSPPPLIPNDIPNDMRNIHSYESNRFTSNQQDQQRHYNNTSIHESDPNSNSSRNSGSPEGIGPRPDRTSPSMESNPRKRRSDSTSREFIAMMKQQIIHLQQQVADFERKYDGDDEVHVEQIISPSDMRDQVEDDTTRSRQYDSSSYAYDGPHRRNYNDNGRSNLYYKQQSSPNFNQFTQSGLESPHSSISSTDERFDSMRSSPNGLSKFENSSRHSVSPKLMDDAKRQKLDDSLYNKKLTSLCQVCGDRAPEHIHYGSVSCFSCRAFFRRSVSKSHLYVCPGNKRCSIVVTTRKNCQYCRYNACLKAGMRPTWVLTDKEKQERNKSKKQNASNNRDSFQSKENIRGGKPSFPLCKFTPSDDHYIHDILLKQHAPECKQDFGKHTSHAIAKCLQSEDGNIKTLKLPRWAALEIFRVQYSRFSKFANLISDFNSLSKRSQDLLLQNNLGSIAIIKMAQIFRERPNQADTNLNVTSDGGISFATQLCEMGFDEKMASDIGSQVSQPPNTLNLEQVFRATDLSHLALHRRVFQQLDKLISSDEKSVFLYQIINLFNTSNIGPELDAIERRRIEAIQERWTNLLLGYSQRKFGYVKSMMLLPKIILLTFELRLLSEKNRIDE